MVTDYRTFPQRFLARKDRWEFLLDFLRDWNFPISGAPVVSPRQLQEAEARLGFPLPVALAEWYGLPFNPYCLNPRLYWTWMIGPADLEVWVDASTNEGWIVIMREYQDCCQWAFRVRDAGLPDPPIFHGHTGFNRTDSTWVEQDATLSGFFQHLTMIRGVTGAKGYSACVQDVDDDAVFERLGQFFSGILGLVGWREYGESCDLLGGEDVLLLTGASPPWGDGWDIYLNARTGTARERVTQLLGVEWDSVHDPEGCD
jgi:hypothetical protein